MAVKNILLVEDEEIIGFLHSKQIQSLGEYRTVIVSDYDDYMNQLASKMIDLVLMDVQLGISMSGVELAKKGLAVHSTPIVFVTGDVSSVPESVLEDVDEFKCVVQKPLRKEKIIELFDEFL